MMYKRHKDGLLKKIIKWLAAIMMGTKELRLRQALEIENQRLIEISLQHDILWASAARVWKTHATDENGVLKDGQEWLDLQAALNESRQVTQSFGVSSVNGRNASTGNSGTIASKGAATGGLATA